MSTRKRPTPPAQAAPQDVTLQHPTIVPAHTIDVPAHKADEWREQGWIDPTPQDSPADAASASPAGE